MLLKAYVGTVVLAATVTGVWSGLLVPAAEPQHLRDVLLLAGLVFLAERIQVRHYHDGDHVGAVNLMEGILAPLIFFTSGATAVAVCAGALLAADIGRNQPMKVAFNVAQWTFAIALGSLVVHAMRDGGEPSLLIVIVAMLVMGVVNQIMITTVLVLATGVVSHGDAPRKRAFLMGMVSRLIGSGAAVATGLCLISLYTWSPWLLSVGAVFLVGLATAGRANAAVRNDHKRLEGLQRATHSLATSLDAAQAIPTFLTEARAGFEVRMAQLVIFGERESVVHTATELNGYSTSHGTHELAELLRTAAPGEPLRLIAGTDDALSLALETSGHRRALAVPLATATDALGMLLLYDRVGMEGFEAGELSVASALARELVGFIDRVELMHAIDEERRKLADIVESTSDGILTIDAEGVVTSWNAGLAEMTGYAAEEMVGTRHFGLLRARDGNGRDVLIERWLDVIETGGALPADLQVVSADGQTLWLSCSYSRIPASEGHRDVLVVVARNITQARELERLKDDFVAVVSHELRTPLVPIKGWAQTLINRGDRLSEDQRRTAVQSILAQAQKLESLVLNILEASRIEAGRADGEGVADVAAVVMRVVEDTLSARPDRVVRVRPPSVPSQVRGSSVWVERAVANLVANAIKYSPDDEAVDVAVSVEGDDVVVSVTDRGPGIALDGQERIFERFERLEETRKQTGTGLGLYITRRLARAMGGDVSVSSVPGAGSTFLLRLPLAPVQTTVLPEPRSGEADKAVNSGANVVNLR
jgi:PAS domain S-box-containing protein